MSWNQIKANIGGQKAFRLAQAVRSGRGIVKVSSDGSLVWIFAEPPRTITEDGHTIDAQTFIHAAAELHKIDETDVYRLADDEIRNIARVIAGIQPQAPSVARVDVYESR